MMNILHTADLHLKKDEETRLEVLRWLIKKAEALCVDIFIIAGDLFESDTDATVLRPHLKKLFDETKIKFLIIPGNHDLKSYDPSYDYGKNASQLIKSPFDIYESDGLRIAAIPYQEKRFSECVKDIPAGIDILIAHGTLYDTSFIFSMLDDEETRYMPIHPASLAGIARYVLLGHLHARNIEKEYKGTKVIYPGAPIALDTKCEGTRVFYLINAAGAKAVKVDIAPFWQREVFFVFPGVEQRILADLENFIKEVDDPKVMPNIIIRGFIGERDRDFNDQIEALKKNYQSRFKNLKITQEIQAWDKIVKNHMVKNFIEKTKILDDKLRMKVFEITFPIFSEIIT